MIDFVSSLLTEPPLTNIAWKLVTAVLPTDASSPWGRTLQLFTSVLFFLCGLSIAFGTVQAIVASAHTGKPLGERWHQIWTPLRVVVGLGLLAPMPSGFSPAHYLLRDVVARSGINLADDAWKVFVSVIAKDGVTITPTSSAGSTVAMAVLQHEVCAAVYNKAGALWGWETPRPAPMGNVSGLGMLGYDKLVTWSYGPTCGRFSYTVPDNRDTFSDARRKAVSDLVNAFRPEAAKYAKLAAETSGISSADGMTRAIASTVLSPHLVVDIRAAGARFDKAVSDAAKATVGTIETESRSKLAEGAETDGFLTAGMYFMGLSQISQLTTSLTNELIEDTPPRLDGDFGRAIERAFAALRLQVTGEMERASLSANDFAAAGDDQSGLLTKMLAPVARSLAEWAATASAKKGDAMSALVSSGHAMISIGWGAIAAGGVLMTVASNSVSDALGADGAALWFSDFGKPIVGLLLLIGSIRAYLIPVLPFFFLMMAGVALVSALLEAMIALPIWCMRWMKMDNSDSFAGESVRGGLMLTVDIFLRPVLAILALAGSYPVFNVLLGTLDKVWATAFLAQTGGSVVGLLGFFVLSILQAYMTWFICLQLFGQSWLLPDRIPRWIGISGSGGEATMTNKAIMGVLALAGRATMPKMAMGLKPGGKK
ncbi:DotA/TraY family protein [Rhizobium leguminosarum]|nr:DotA/TraY family protein [Rhizobium leguminosarum]